MSHRKGVYNDGHEREDVVKYLGEHLKILEEYRSIHQPTPLCGDEDPQLYQLHHHQSAMITS